MRRWLLLGFLAAVTARPLLACTITAEREEKNPTVYSPNHRFAVILRMRESIPDFASRSGPSTPRDDPPPRWGNLPVAVYRGPIKVSEFHVAIDTVTDLMIASSGRYVVGLLRTKSYPCWDPPWATSDRVATIFRRDGTVVGAITVGDVVPLSRYDYDPHVDPLRFSLRTERNGREVLLIRYADVVRRVALETAEFLDDPR